MNYNLNSVANIRPTQIEYTVDENRQYGQLPMEMLTTKFEETDMGGDESSYDSYARKTLTNWGPDTNQFEHEAPRGGTEARAGRLNTRLYGHRGTADLPNHPEMFLGFQGMGDADPRGVTTDPNMSLMADQQRARMRFVRFSPDGNESITSGARNEWKIMEDQQTVFKWVRNQMKWFATQKDGRREGLRRTWQHRPDVTKCVVVRGYGDYITNQALNPQRRSVLISDKIIRDSVAYRTNCMDQDRAVMRYGASGRKRVVKDTSNRVADATTDGRFSQQDVGKCYKAMSLLLSEIVRGKSQTMQMAATGDTEHAESAGTMARKQSAAVRDLITIMKSITTDGSWGDSDVTRMMKTATPKTIEHMAKLITFNHLLPANHYLNAELMYKSVKPGADMQLIKREMLTDSKTPDLRDEKTIAMKVAKIQRQDPRAGLNSLVSISTESSKTHNYKQAKRALDRRRQNTSGEDFKQESDNTQSRKQNHEQYQVTNPGDHVQDMKFSENKYAERHGGRLGSKYMMRDMDRDGRLGDISGIAAGA